MGFKVSRVFRAFGFFMVSGHLVQGLGFGVRARAHLRDRG